MTTSEEVLRDPIFIVGAPRSGTAILADIVRGAPGMAYLREPRLVWRYGNDRRSDILDPEHATPAVVQHIRARFAALAHEQGGTRIVEKLPSGSLRLPFIATVFPDARFVHVRRDGYDAVAAIRDKWLDGRRDLAAPRQADRLRRHLREASPRQYATYAGELVRKVAPEPGGLYRPWGPRLPGMRELFRERGVLEVAALQWRTCVERAALHGRAMSADRYVEVRLESLDAAAIEAVARFCAVEPAPLLAALDAHYEIDRIVDRGDRLTPDERRRVEAWIAPTVAWLEGTAVPHRPATA